jgi:hypothetical protein
MGFLRNIAFACAAALTPLLLTEPVQAEAPEYQVKAAMLYKFALFVEWPAKAFATETSPFVACVVGQDPFGKWLQHELGEASSALLVSDMGELDDFCRLGGEIGLLKQEGKVRFELHVKAIAKAGLKVDSRLMRVALTNDCGETK